MAQLLDELHVDQRAEPDLKKENDTQEVPAAGAEAVVEAQLVERLEEQRENATRNGVCAVSVPEPSVPPGPSVGPQEHVQPPDITSTITQSQPDRPLVRAEGEQEQRPADILDQVPLTDRPADPDSSGPTKPPRQFTVEPDIVASTKKPPPSRPPPPGGCPPPRPPPPSWTALPPGKKTQEPLRLSGLEGRRHSRGHRS